MARWPGGPVAAVRLDLRGHGRSDAAGAPELGDDFAALLTDLVPDGTVVLVGHSLGGMAVMAMADRHTRSWSPTGSPALSYSPPPAATWPR